MLQNLAVTDGFVHAAEGGGILGGDDEPLGVPVDAVAERRRKGLLGSRVVFALVVEVFLDLVEQRNGAVLPPVRVHAGGLVHDEDVPVLVGGRDLTGGVPERVRRFGLGEELVLCKDADGVALGEQLVALAACAVQADVLLADELVEHPLRAGGHELHEEFIEPLTGIVSRNGDDSHIAFLSGFCVETSTKGRPTPNPLPRGEGAIMRGLRPLPPFCGAAAPRPAPSGE